VHIRAYKETLLDFHTLKLASHINWGEAKNLEGEIRGKRNRLGLFLPSPPLLLHFFCPCPNFLGSQFKSKKGSKVVFLSVNVCYIGYLREIDQRKKKRKKKGSIDEKE